MKIRNSTYSIPSLILSMLFISLIVVCIIVVISSFTNLLQTSNYVIGTSANLYNEIRKQELLNNDTIILQYEKALINQHEIKAKGTLDSATISFLFELFTVALITIGVYLLSNTHKDYKRIKKSAQYQNEYNFHAIIIISFLTNIDMLSLFLRDSTLPYRPAIVTQLREHVKNLNEYLKRCSPQDLRNNMHLIKELVDVSKRCELNLRQNLDEDMKTITKDIKDTLSNLNIKYAKFL